jgi:hypothetical protein
MKIWRAYTGHVCDSAADVVLLQPRFDTRNSHQMSCQSILWLKMTMFQVHGQRLSNLQCRKVAPNEVRETCRLMMVDTQVADVV